MSAGWEDVVHSQEREVVEVPDVLSAVVVLGGHLPQGCEGVVRSGRGVVGGVGRVSGWWEVEMGT